MELLAKSIRFVHFGTNRLAQCWWRCLHPSFRVIDVASAASNHVFRKFARRNELRAFHLDFLFYVASTVIVYTRTVENLLVSRVFANCILPANDLYSESAGNLAAADSNTEYHRTSPLIVCFQSIMIPVMILTTFLIPYFTGT